MGSDGEACPQAQRGSVQQQHIIYPPFFLSSAYGRLTGARHVAGNIAILPSTGSDCNNSSGLAGCVKDIRCREIGCLDHWPPSTSSRPSASLHRSSSLH